MTKKTPFLPFFTRFYTVFSQNRKIPKWGGRGVRLFFVFTKLHTYI